ncbi:MAG: general secretion pathway protein GspK [Planctomyces sp.]|nr:general secretion pathway protein GspK [Planctomyces sp.]
MAFARRISKGLRSARRGTALIVVLIVVVMLSLGAYTFCELMIAEAKATTLFEQDAQARMLADSGIELAAAVLGSPMDTSLATLYHSPELFGGIALSGGETPLNVGRFSIVAPVENDGTGQIRFGTIDESSKWNLNALLSAGFSDEELLTILLSVPGMTDVIADSILDWIDSDESPREFGAESSYYRALTPPYDAKNGRLDSLDELLLIQGVTPWLLYGEDANRNGRLDPNENDGDLSAPWDNSDGVLDLGWSAYFTVHSRETNLRSDGLERINLNQALLTELYDTLEEEFGPDMATFVVAFRLFGPVNPVSNGGAPTTGNQSADEALKKLAEDIAKGLFSGTAGDVTRNGLDLSGGSQVQFVSLYELIDAEVAAVVDGKETLLASPWTSGSSDLANNWPLVADSLSLSDSSWLEGRININQARYEVLLGIPGMTSTIADGIVSQRLIGSDGAALADRMTIQSTTAWLLSEGIMDQTELVSMDKYITARGSVHRVQSVGHFDGGGPVARVEAVIDATELPPRIIFRRDLSSLGPGFTSDQLAGVAAP